MLSLQEIPRDVSGHNFLCFSQQWVESEGHSNPQIPQTPVLRRVVNKENLRLWI